MRWIKSLCSLVVIQFLITFTVFSQSQTILDLKGDTLVVDTSQNDILFVFIDGISCVQCISQLDVFVAQYGKSFTTIWVLPCGNDVLSRKRSIKHFSEYGKNVDLFGFLPCSNNDGLFESRSKSPRVKWHHLNKELNIPFEQLFNHEGVLNSSLLLEKISK